MYINRLSEDLLQTMIASFKVVLITGPRQVGKTTLLQHVLGDSYTYITLDDITLLEVAQTDPKIFFLNNPGKVAIDEVQYAPELFREIKRIVDSKDEYGQIILTGSQTFSLMSRVTESLAGRIGIMELDGLSLREINKDTYNQPVIPHAAYLEAVRPKTSIPELWKRIHRGSLPELYKDTSKDRMLFYAAYVRTYLERDVRNIVSITNISDFSKCMVALAARTGQVVNYGAIANELAVDTKTVQSWVRILETSGLVTVIRPYSNNRLSRAIKMPKVYFMDTGLVCYLLNWPTPETLMNGAMSGAILENFVVSEIIKSFRNRGVLHLPLYFYRDRDGKEIDLVIEDAGVLYPIEIKKNATPKASMAKHGNILHKAVGYTVGPKVIMCLIDRPMYLTEDIIAYPITEL